jgi:hypothetical protein
VSFKGLCLTEIGVSAVKSVQKTNESITVVEPERVGTYVKTHVLKYMFQHPDGQNHTFCGENRAPQG